jgi:hypothetical protein
MGLMDMEEETRNTWVLIGFGALGFYLLWTNRDEGPADPLEEAEAEKLQKVLMGSISTDRVMTDDLMRLQRKLDRHAGAFDPDALERGTKYELETTHNPLVAKKLAMDRLAERPDYYDALRDEDVLPDEAG